MSGVNLRIVPPIPFDFPMNAYFMTNDPRVASAGIVFDIDVGSSLGEHEKNALSKNQWIRCMQFCKTLSKPVLWCLFRA